MQAMKTDSKKFTDLIALDASLDNFDFEPVTSKSLEPLKLSDYDHANALTEAAEIAAFLADALETNDESYIAKAKNIAKQAELRNRINDLLDIKHANLIMERIKAGKEKLYTSDEVKKILGL